MDKFQEYLEGLNSFDLTHPSLVSLGILGQKNFVNYYINQIQLLQLGYNLRGLVNIYYVLLGKIADLYVYTEQYQMAENIFKSLLFVGDKTVFYNMACLYSLMGKKKEALIMLKRAIKAGYMDLRWMKKDKELDPIRNTPQFKKLEKYLEKKLKNQ
jgi:tetratricopeptide (TPR) repeat protein